MNGGTCLCAHGGSARCPLHQYKITGNTIANLDDGETHSLSIAVRDIDGATVYIDGNRII